MSTQAPCGPALQAYFDFTASMRAICADMVLRLDELSHIDLSCVAICFCQARRRVSHGTFASLTPLRFAGGATSTSRRGRKYAIQRLVDPAGREMLYILSFYLPRFMDLPLSEKLITILHELWHISPKFDGDIRRHAGRCYAHTGSQKNYDAHMDRLARQWLAQNPPEPLWDFLKGSLEDVLQRHSGVVGIKIARPKLIPLAG
jgi:predicted metallopeptidase